MDNIIRNTMKNIIILALLILVSIPVYSQDKRSTETRVADLLAMMPVNNTPDLDKQMKEMTLLGPEGRKQITGMIVPPGTGNDTRARFAVESYSRYLSAYGHDDERLAWELECIDAVHASGYPMVRAFFLSQLQYIGTKRSAEFAAGFLTDEKMCEPAVALISSCDYAGKEEMLAMSLQIKSLPCAAAVINELARMKSDKAIQDYLSWYMTGGADIRAAALNALAESAHEDAYKTLSGAAADANYGWDPAGASAALVQYARNMGARGDVKAMERICREILSNAAVQYKTAALEAMVHHMGYEAINYLLSGFLSEDIEYRIAILRLANDIPGVAATRKWIDLLPDLDYTRKAEIIQMLGDRGDMLAAEPIRNSLYCPSAELRTTAAMALAKLQGRESVQELIDYLRSYETADDQVAAYVALKTLLDSRKRDMIARALEGSSDNAKAIMLVLLAEGGENRFFNTLLGYTSSADPKLRAVAFSGLRNLAEPANQQELIDLLLITTGRTETANVQLALAAAANKISHKQERADEVLKAMQNSAQKEKFMPVLAMLGGEEALKAVKEEFDRGRAEMRAVAFDALAEWSDYEAHSVLFDICASGNKNYSERAFYAYVDKVSGAPLTDAGKLKLLEKIMPYAFTDEQKSALQDRIDIFSKKDASSAEEKTPGEKVFELAEEEKAEGFVPLFDGLSLENWTGNKEAYVVEDGMIVVRPVQGSGGNLYTRDEYSDFIFRFEFQLTPGANNGLGIRAPLEGDAAYEGMELQILDNTAEIYAGLKPYQYHGSVYGVIPAKRGFLKPPGEWNRQEVIVKGSTVKVILNGTLIVDGDISYAIRKGTLDGRDHPGLKRKSGHIAFLGHGSELKFRNIRIKEL